MKTLAKEHGIFGASQTGGIWSLDDFSQGWRVQAPTGVFISDTYFDLGGMTQREKTLFFDAATVQDLLAPQVTAGAAGDSMVIVDLMTTKSLTDAQAANYYVRGNFADSGAVLTFEETVYARVEQFVVDLDTAAWGSMVKVSSTQTGSLKATASDRIYSYRIIALGTPFTGTDIDVSGCRHLINANVREEPDFQYLMRLRRSFELAQNHDED
jgi:hypothetical protein